MVKYVPMGTTGAWKKVGSTPVIGREWGTTFDLHVIKERQQYRMWFSWRNVRLIAHTSSEDGIHWDLPQAVLDARHESTWENDEVNRPTLVFKDGLYHMWYTGQTFAGENKTARSCIGYATSTDGLHWQRRNQPVLEPQQEWEKYCVMCPHVIWDEIQQCFHMWYSGGHMHEADAIGYARSKDGILWERPNRHPVFTPDSDNYWEMSKVEACYVMQQDGWYYMFYMGVHGDYKAAVGLARSRDGMTNWQRHPDNPIIAADDDGWDYGGLCKIGIVREVDGYLLWYNASNVYGEQIGLCMHKGFDLFPKNMENYIPERGIATPEKKPIMNYYYNRKNMQ